MKKENELHLDENLNVKTGNGLYKSNVITEMLSLIFIGAFFLLILNGFFLIYESYIEGAFMKEEIFIFFKNLEILTLVFFIAILIMAISFFYNQLKPEKDRCYLIIGLDISLLIDGKKTITGTFFERIFSKLGESAF